MALDTSTVSIPLGESSLARARRTVTRPVRRAIRVVATSDPDLSRLRTATTTITCLIVVAIVLFALAAITHLSAIGIIPGLMLTMISNNAVREPRAKPRAVTILLMIPSAMIGVTLASLTNDVTLVADIVFVAVAMAAIFVRVIGQRGVPIGMIAFMTYFISIFTKVDRGELPEIYGAIVIAALVVIALRWLLRPRHPDRDLRRMLGALGVRAGRVLDAVDEGVRAGGIDEKLHRSVASRLAASSSTASGAEQALGTADHPLVDGLANAELSVRIFDFQLTLERLHSVVRRVLVDKTLTDDQRLDLSQRLRRLRRAVHAPAQMSREQVRAEALGDEAQPFTSSIPVVAGHGAHVSPDGVSESDERLETMGRLISFGFASWQGIVARGPDGDPAQAAQAAETVDDLEALEPADPADDPSPTPRQRRRDALPQLARTAVQVGLAGALALAAGTALSPTRWFWASIAAFVVYIGTSTRGEILSKGWLRVVGTLGGVVFGVLIAGVVSGNFVVSIVLIVICLFLGFYFMQVSQVWMIFGITTMLALLYGLLGEFSVGLLLLRLEETALGAAIGILVSYFVFPNSTRDAMRAGTRTFLGALSSSLGTAVRRLSMPTRPVGGAAAAPDDARALRDSYLALTTTSKPVTQGWSGVSNRSGSRRTLVILGACEYHGRALMRLADGALGAADTPALREALDRAVAAVRADIDAFVGALDTRMSEVTLRPAGDVIDLLEDHTDLDGSRRYRALTGVARHLHAIDQALCNRASELGATLEPLRAGEPAGASGR
ncbi:hypothetical protein AX769_17020 [Frondihabitans sp. PAMC 28766]|uniref:FUSC family protein n=1 Tax=Frondihabitans sp. PAMC 28766 TaxID=1795630 RepID=UPI00078CD620|nr:FUSC family protein [Frondihabitans sp. PAMC 28766]AMM21532.1 hypothetical protein AX769_17020 [Frondihabitans sp. PAMC 28766]